MLVYGSRNASKSMIFLHGYGQSAQDARNLFSKTITYGTLKKLSLVCFFPDSPWFTYTDDNSLDYDQQSLYTVRKYIHEKINSLINVYENVILMGYSQGASVALDAALTFSQVSIPVVSISGILLRDFVVRPGESYLSDKRHPIYVAHGISDTEIPFQLANSSFKNTIVTRTCHFSGTHWDFWSDAYFSDFILNSLKEILVVNSRAVA